MASLRVVRIGTAVALLATATACASPGRAAPAAPTTAADVVPAAPDAVVLQVQAVGGEHADRLATALPSLVLYADGRVFTPAPMIMIAPGPALPTWNVQEIDPSGVQAVIDRALAAGIAEPGEVGSPATGEARLRVTLTTAAGTHVRDVRLSDAAPVGLDALDDQFLEGGVPWAPAAVAAVVQPWADLPDLPAQPDAAWVGPAVPGEPFGEGPGCVVATGDQARAVLDAARSATTATPWVTPDGARWAVSFRPLLPHENGCADLLPQ